jgi:hypothetical protein
MILAAAVDSSGRICADGALMNSANVTRYYVIGESKCLECLEVWLFKKDKKVR